MSKLLTVFGATGQQGGALIDSVLNGQELSAIFKLRGITRDVTKPSAISLKEKGVEMIQADLDEPSSLGNAVAGSEVIFAITNHWEKASAAVEVAQGKAMADAAVTAGVTQIIWSSLPNVTKMTKGELTDVKHFDAKAEVEEYIRTLGIKSMFFMPGWFMQNHLKMLKPQLHEDGTYIFSQSWIPISVVPLIDIKDIGKFISPALLHPDLYNGKNFTCATAFYTPLEMVETWTKITGKGVRFHHSGEIEPSSLLTEAQKRETKKARGLITKWAYFGPTGKEDLKWTLEQMTEKPTTWEEFVQENQPWFEN